MGSRQMARTTDRESNSKCYKYYPVKLYGTTLHVAKAKIGNLSKSGIEEGAENVRENSTAKVVQ